MTSHANTDLTILPATRWNRRQLLSSLAAVPAVALVLAACGEAASDAQATQPTRPTQPTATDSPPPSPPPSQTDGLPSVPEISAPPSPTEPEVTVPPIPAEPTPPITGGGGEILVRLDTGVDSFTTAEFAFRRAPAMLITDDGWAVRVNDEGIDWSKAPVVPRLERRALTPQQLALVVDAARGAGLLAAPPDYDQEIMVADAGATVVVVGYDGESFTHRAEALGFDTERDSPARRKLGEFAAVIEKLDPIVGAGTWEPFVADRWELMATVVNPSDFTGDVAPTIVEFPADAGVALASARCTPISGAQVTAWFATGAGVVFYRQGDANYRVALSPTLAGTRPCT